MARGRPSTRKPLPNLPKKPAKPLEVKKQEDPDFFPVSSIDTLTSVTPYIPRDDSEPTEFSLNLDVFGDDDITPFVPYNPPTPDIPKSAPLLPLIVPPQTEEDILESKRLGDMLVQSGHIDLFPKSTTTPLPIVEEDDDNNDDDDEENEEQSASSAAEDDSYYSSSSSSSCEQPPPPVVKKQRSPPPPPVVPIKKEEEKVESKPPVQRKAQPKKKPRVSIQQAIPDEKNLTDFIVALVKYPTILDAIRLKFPGVSELCYQVDPSIKKITSKGTRRPTIADAAAASSSSSSSSSSTTKKRARRYSPEDSEYWDLSLDDLSDYCPKSFTPFLGGKHQLPVFEHKMGHILPARFYQLVMNYARPLIFQAKPTEPPSERAKMLLFTKDPTGETRPILPPLKNIINIDECLQFFPQFAKSDAGKELVEICSRYIQEIRHAFPNGWKTITLYVLPKNMIGRHIFHDVTADRPYVFVSIPLEEQERDGDYKGNRNMRITVKSHGKDYDWLEPVDDESALSNRDRIKRNNDIKKMRTLETDIAFNIYPAFAETETTIGSEISCNLSTGTIAMIIG